MKFGDAQHCAISGVDGDVGGSDTNIQRKTFADSGTVPERLYVLGCWLVYRQAGLQATLTLMGLHSADSKPASVIIKAVIDCLSDNDQRSPHPLAYKNIRLDMAVPKVIATKTIF